MPATDLQIDWLRTFVAIVNAGSLTAATRHVARSQSAVSMQLKKLEDSLGQPLLVRGARHMTLTPAGYDLLGHARELLALHDRAVAALHGGAVTGRVSVGTPDDYARAYLAPVLRRFADRHPQVQVTVLCEPSTGLLERLRHGELDLAIMSRDAPGRGELLFREPLIWAGAEPHRVWLREPLPIAVHSWDRRLRAAVFAAVSAQRRRYRIVYNSSSVSGQLAAAESGLALAIITRCSLPANLKALDASHGLPVLPEVEVALARSTHTQRSPAVEALHEQLMAVLGGGPLE